MLVYDIYIEIISVIYLDVAGGTFFSVRVEKNQHF